MDKSFKSESAGGQEEHPCDVKSSINTEARSSAATCDAHSEIINPTAIFRIENNEHTPRQVTIAEIYVILLKIANQRFADEFTKLCARLYTTAYKLTATLVYIDQLSQKQPSETLT